MGTIVARQRKNKTTAYMAKIVIRREGKVVHRETETFDRRAVAAAWIARRESELAEPGALDRREGNDATLADAIDKYVKSHTEIGRTKAQVLRTLKDHDIAARACSQITSADLVELAADLGKTRKPQTVGNYMSHLQAVFAVANDAWGMPLDEAQMGKAMKASRRLGAVRKSSRRDRRPTLGEIDKLMQHFLDIWTRRPSSVPMHRVMAFALFSTRRLEEITRIRRADYEHDRVLVRDMKHPGQKIGNDVWVTLPDPAPAIIDAMPDDTDLLFPFTTDAIGAAFTRACQFLDIEDLHFHDLRHEGVSRLFEMGWDIPRAAQVSGHRSWLSLQRYTHVRQTGDKYAGWPWLDVVTKKNPPG